MMRTTFTIEDRLLDELKRTARDSGKPFKQVVNEVLRAGLEARTRPQPQPYRLEPASMGRPLQGHDLTKARQLSDELEDDAIAEKVAQRK